MIHHALACCGAFAALLAPAAAKTTPAPSPVAEKIASAVEKASSFRVQLSYVGGTTGTVTVVAAQKRTKTILVTGPTTSETILAGGRMYGRINGNDWHATVAPGRAAQSPAKMIADPAMMRVLADHAENGTTVGVYEINTLDASMPSLTLTCTYDKKTYLPRKCANATFTQTFEGWNDPANVVDVPVVASPIPASGARPGAPPVPGMPSMPLPTPPHAR